MSWSEFTKCGTYDVYDVPQQEFLATAGVLMIGTKKWCSHSQIETCTVRVSVIAGTLGAMGDARKFAPAVVTLPSGKIELWFPEKK